jgi:hypothetical protein
MRKFLSLQKASLPNDSGKFIDNTKTRRNSRAYRGVISGKLHLNRENIFIMQKI